ncbi:RHS repeat-associated core domain-containing protein, partial [Aureicoccus marinus]|uniref:RHS repeat-associated core domain-containing protein n=1 Tax=Aureicoccus marinus TaxID=754435 RepID=UPI0015E48C62
NNGTATIKDENNYYPFGLEHKGYNDIVNGNEQRRKYQGKEYEEEHGLNTYDFSARNYIPDLGRWTTLDPLAELDYSLTPYNYTMNNPVLLTDPTGLSTHVKLNDDGEWEVVEGGDPDDSDDNIYIIVYDEDGNAINTG